MVLGISVKAMFNAVVNSTHMAQKNVAILYIADLVSKLRFFKKCIGLPYIFAFRLSRLMTVVGV